MRVCGEGVLLLAGAELGHVPFVSLEFILILPSRLRCYVLLFLRGWGFSLTSETFHHVSTKENILIRRKTQT